MIEHVKKSCIKFSNQSSSLSFLSHSSLLQSRLLFCLENFNLLKEIRSFQTPLLPLNFHLLKYQKQTSFLPYNSSLYKISFWAPFCLLSWKKILSYPLSLKYQGRYLTIGDKSIDAFFTRTWKRAFSLESDISWTLWSTVMSLTYLESALQDEENEYFWRSVWPPVQKLVWP